MAIRSFLLSPLTVLVLSACATTQYYWHHNQLTGQGAEQRLVVDRSACTAAAHRAMGQPPPPMSSDTAMGGYAAGAHQAEIENQYRSGLTDVFNGCMAQRGWMLQAVTR
jgi:hypothetical protein